MNQDLEALLTLLHTPQMGPAKIKKILNVFPSPSAAVSSLELKEPKSVKKDIELATTHQVKLIPFFDPKYPKPLLTLSNPPLLLYILGDLTEKDLNGLAIVGTRNATLYGKEMAYTFGERGALGGKTIISGLARGIDTEAHKGALTQGRTIAVVGSGLANLYPTENVGLAKEISQRGALISEFPMETPPSRYTFPQRNKIVAALASELLLVESPLKGGAMITFEMAKRLKKRCYALPGRIDVPTFAGNLTLLKKGEAEIVTKIEDIVPCPQKSNQPPLSKEEMRFLAHLPHEEISLDALVLLTQLPVMKLNVLLTRLVMKKVVKEFPGKLFKRLT